ncbi:MAG: hypothetical protein ACJA01_000412 [Saprospiraceae bacterium]|jgi:hypothetical protein
MQNYHLIIVLIALLLTSCKTAPGSNFLKSVDKNGLSAADRAVGWVSLFNGTDMNHWRVYREEGVRGWKVEDGDMVALGLHGNSADLITKDTFSNIELYVEWNIADGGNSGIFYNVREGDELHAVYYSGPEYQLLDDTGYKGNLTDKQLSGSNYDMEAPSSKNEVKLAGEWNSSRIIVDEGHVEHWLNGKMVVSYDIGSAKWQDQKMNSKWKDMKSYAAYKSGHIALQDHGNEIRFRNLKIRRI